MNHSNYIIAFVFLYPQLIKNPIFSGFLGFHQYILSIQVFFGCSFIKVWKYNLVDFINKFLRDLV